MKRISWAGIGFFAGLVLGVPAEAQVACGNSSCETSWGESPTTCPQDCLDAAEVGEAYLPPSLDCGAWYVADVEMVNTGSTTWKGPVTTSASAEGSTSALAAAEDSLATSAAGEVYALTAVGTQDRFAAQLKIAIPTDTLVPPQGKHKFRVTLQGPTDTVTGSDITGWTMVREGEQGWRQEFPQSVEQAVSWSSQACSTGGPGAGAGAFPGIVRLDNGQYLLVQNTSSYSPEQVTDLVLKAFRSTAEDCVDRRTPNGLFTGGGSPGGAQFADEVVVTDHYLAWFDYCSRPC